MTKAQKKRLLKKQARADKAAKEQDNAMDDDWVSASSDEDKDPAAQ